MKRAILCAINTLCLGAASSAFAQYTGAPITTSPYFTDSPGAPLNVNGFPIPRVLCQSAVSSLIYNSTTSTTHGTTTFAAYPTDAFVLATCNIPAGAMGLNGMLRITSQVSYTNSSNTKYFGSSLGGSGIFSRSASATGVAYYIDFIANRNSASSQAANYQSSGTPFGYNGNSVITASVNTANAQNLLLTANTTAESGVSQTANAASPTNVCTATVASGAYATGDMITTSGITYSTTHGSVASCANVSTPTAATNISGTQYSYACTCTASDSATVQGSGVRYSRIQLESYTVELIPGAN